MASPTSFQASGSALVAAVFFILSIAISIAQEGADAREPFVNYPAESARYLERLHDQTSAPLAFRADYPGGIPAWQSDARKKLADLLGLQRISEQNAKHHPSVVLTEDVIQEQGYTRRSGVMNSEPGVAIPFWLLQPNGTTSTPRPLVVCAHGHSGDGWKTYAGVYNSDEQRAATLAKDGDPGVQAVQRGYIALVPATRGLADAAAVPDLKGRHGKRPCRAQLIHCLLAGRTAVGERVWDIQRLLDWALENLEGIDAERVVLLGNSGGGVLTVYAAAMDERIKVAVPSCSFTSFTSGEGFVFHCDCCVVPRAQMELGDMSDIGGLTAPRALLAVHGRKDGLHHFPDVEKAMARVRSIYAAAGASESFDHAWGTEGHKFYPELMWPFIERQLEH